MAEADTKLFSVSVGDGTIFQVTATHWPESTPVSDAPRVLGSYWPPMGVEVLGDLVSKAERAFAVDVASDESLARFESDFGLYVSEKLPGQVAVHAALLLVDSAVVIVPGSSGAGKSSLCVAAMEAGWEVWSDEYCLIDTATGEVSGWPRPIRQRLSGGGVRRIDHPGHRGPGRATHVITMTYVKEATGPALTLEPMSPGQVAMDLMANTVCARSRSEETFWATTGLAKTVTGLAGVRGDISDALPAIRRALTDGV